ncbi:electron transfer flavoprotein subunit beta/FixA family protein [Pseudolysinimonas sp.]|uniref:electron transfer flavoprotein subunit beta/FixA family protein n=1 Tax=Pseudolysinimonas sp. TaxID=2680009 RepID=UPI003F7E35AA
MRIAVLIKQVPDTWGDRRLDPATGRVDRTDGEQVIDEIDERALEVALAHRDGDKATEVVAVVMGPAQAADAVKKALSTGADSAVHVVDDGLAGADAGLTAAALAGALRAGSYDLVIAGNVSTDGRGGVVPAMIAEHLGIPALSSLDTVEIGADAVGGSRTTDAGQETLRAPLPALVSVTERVPEARFPNFKSIMAARKKPVQRLALADLGVASAARSVVLETRERPAREAGTIVVDDGTAAQQLVDYLVAERLV